MAHLGGVPAQLDKFRRKLLQETQGRIENDVLEKILASRVKDELASGVQTIQYQINTLMTTIIKPTRNTFLKSKKDDEYIKENAMIVEEILRQRLEGIKMKQQV